MRDIKEVKYHLFAAIIVIVCLFVVTISSMFFPSNNISRDSGLDNQVEQEEENNNTTNRVDPLDIEMISEESEKYIVKLEKPKVMYNEVQKEIDDLYNRKKEQFLQKVRNSTLEQGAEFSLTSKPVKKETAEYVFILIEFAETIEGAKEKVDDYSFAYSKNNGKLLSLSEVLNHDNKNNEIYKQLIPYIKPVLVENVLSQADKFSNRNESREVLVSLVEAGLQPSQETFSVWYIENDRLVFIFPPSKVAPYEYGKQEAGVYFNIIISSLRN